MKTKIMLRRNTIDEDKIEMYSSLEGVNTPYLIGIVHAEWIDGDILDAVDSEGECDVVLELA